MQVLVISSLAVKIVGNQSLFNTLHTFADNGHKVYFMSIRKKERELGQFHPNITIITVSMIPKFVRPLWVIVRSILYLIEKIIKGIFSILKKNNNGKKAVYRDGPMFFGEPESVMVDLFYKISFILNIFTGIYKGISIIKKQKIDVIYGHEVSCVIPAYVLGKMFKIPVISRFQGTILYPILEEKKKMLRYIEHVIAMKIPADLVVMTNDGTRGDEVLKELGVNKDKIRFWSNGLDFDIFIPGFNGSLLRKSLAVEESTTILMSITILKGWKRLDRQIRAMPYVIEKCPDTVLIIVGQGEWRNTYEELVKKMNLINHVKFVGGIQHSKVREYLNCADIFLNFFDLTNRGNPVMEAMLCGKCVVTFKDGSNDDLIDNGDNAIALSPYSTAQQIADAITEVVVDTNKRKLIAKNARKTALKKLLPWDIRNKNELKEVLALGKK